MSGSKLLGSAASKLSVNSGNDNVYSSLEDTSDENSDGSVSNTRWRNAGSILERKSSESVVRVDLVLAPKSEHGSWLEDANIFNNKYYLLLK